MREQYDPSVCDRGEGAIVRWICEDAWIHGSTNRRKSAAIITLLP